MNFQLRPETAAQTSRFDALSEADRARAVALCNDIAEFGHEFDAAFTAKNLQAAQICTRRVLTHLTNFNAVVRGTDCEFPAAMFDDMAKLHQALNGGDWDTARQLVRSNAARYNDEAYFRQLRRITSQIKQWAGQQKQAAPEPPQNTEAHKPMPVPGLPLSKPDAASASWTSAVPATVTADIASVEAFDNSLMLDVAMGGSTNTILHTLAIAREAGISYDIKRIDEISRRIPCLCKVSPSSNYHVQDVHRAGGIHTILGELKRMGALNTSCITVTGITLGENIDEWDVRSEKCSAWAKTVRVSGASALVVDPNDKMGPAARTASGNLAPKPMLFLPGDVRAITLWRLAAAFNVGDASAAACLFAEDAGIAGERIVGLQRADRD